MAETGKKAKAPAKLRTTTAAKSTTSTTAAGKSSTGSAKETAAAKIAAYRPTHEEIAVLAQKYWAERGHTDGQDEQDWLRAEQELMKLAS